jgi:hypothetical protein
VAYLTTSSAKNSVSPTLDTKVGKTRYWAITMPLVADNGDKLYLVAMKVSLADMDARTEQSLYRSYFVLFVTILAIILLLVNNTRLFEKFYRIRNDQTSKITGNGLGLWITKQLVELMKGEIMVDSIEKVVTQITLRFPAVKAK